MKTFLVDYQYQGTRYCIELPADSLEDAEKRLWALTSYGKVVGTLEMKVPVEVGFWVPLWCWLRNAWGR